MTFVIPTPHPVTIPVLRAQSRFPVRRVYCVGRNYAEHAREMGHDPDREPPFFFMKPADAVLAVSAGTVAELPYPPQTGSFHYEVELVVALRGGGRDIAVKKALDCVFGYAVGLDMTRRDLQSEAKAKGHPWALAKAADHSAPIGVLSPVEACGHRASGAIVLSVNDATKQKADLSAMIWSVSEQIAYLSRFFELFPGDLIFSGTPGGVGAVERGQTMDAHIDGLTGLTVKVV